MQGNLYALGYFSASVCFGTPQQQFDLIIDTGSSLTAVPCADCTHCGSHQHASYRNARYDSEASSTHSAVDCHHPACNSCRSSDECTYGVSYTEGSSIRGRIVGDVAWFTKLGAGQRVACPTTFGCQTFESGLFNTQVADGISGFSMSHSYGATLFDSLLEATGAPDIFSICLDKEVGAMVLGGNVRPERQLEWISYSGYSAYTVQLTGVHHHSGGRLGVHIGSAIVDSGTSFTYLPPSTYAAVRDLWRSHCPWGNCRTRDVAGQYPDDYCYRMDAATLAGFDDLSLHFSGGVSLSLAPLDYSYELYEGVWCLGVFDNEKPSGVIGACSMRHHEVVFDRQHRRIAFAPTDCKALHDGALESALEGGYGVNGCADTSQSAPPSPQTPLFSPLTRSPPPSGPPQRSPPKSQATAWHQVWLPSPPPPPPLPPLPSLPSLSPPLLSSDSPGSITATTWRQPVIVTVVMAVCAIVCFGVTWCLRSRSRRGPSSSSSSTAARRGSTSRVRVIGLGVDVPTDRVSGMRPRRGSATGRASTSRSRERLRARAAAFASKTLSYKTVDDIEVEAQAVELQTST